MKVFLSWSGPKSHAVATAFADWLPTVLQSVTPWISSKDIEKGATWLTQIKDAIQASNGFGLFFLTKATQTSPWLLFEAGGIASLEQKRVCTVLVDIEHREIETPLNFFQATVLNREDVSKLLETLNANLEVPLAPNVLAKAFARGWPELEDLLAAALKVEPKETTAAAEDAPLVVLGKGVEGIGARLGQLEKDTQKNNARLMLGIATLTAQIQSLAINPVTGAPMNRSRASDFLAASIVAEPNVTANLGLGIPASPAFTYGTPASVGDPAVSQAINELFEKKKSE